MHAAGGVDHDDRPGLHATSREYAIQCRLDEQGRGRAFRRYGCEFDEVFSWPGHGGVSPRLGIHTPRMATLGSVGRDHEDSIPVPSSLTYLARVSFSHMSINQRSLEAPSHHEFDAGVPGIDRSIFPVDLLKAAILRPRREEHDERRDEARHSHDPERGRQAGPDEDVRRDRPA